MRKIREALRLHYDAGLGVRAVSRSLKASPSTVREYLVRAKLQGLTWPLPESLDDAGLLQRLYPTPASSSRALPVPDWSKVHRELRRKGVTLALLWEEYKTVHPEGEVDPVWWTPEHCAEEVSRCRRNNRRMRRSTGARWCARRSGSHGPRARGAGPRVRVLRVGDPQLGAPGGPRRGTS